VGDTLTVGKAKRCALLLTEGAEQDLEAIQDCIAEFDGVLPTPTTSWIS